MISGNLIKLKGTVSLKLNTEEILTKFSSYFDKIPQQCIKCQQIRDNNGFHLTILTPNEEINESIILDTNLIDIYICGLGTILDTWYLFVVSDVLNKFRLANGFGVKNYHITLGFNKHDVHNISKDISTLIIYSDLLIDNVLNNLSSDIKFNIELLSKLYIKYSTNFKFIKNYVNELCKYGDFKSGLAYSYELIQLKPLNITSYYIQLQILHHLNKLDEKIIQNTINKILIIQNPPKIQALKIIKIINEYIVNNSDSNSSAKILYWNNNIVHVELPHNFSKCSVNLYGSSIITKKHLKAISAMNINTIINLIGEEKPSIDIINNACEYNIIIHHIGFTDRTSCSLEIFNKIISIIDEPINLTVVHCLGGIGRTNMVLAGYLMKINNISPSEAIAILKSDRKLIMSSEQILFLKTYYGYLANNLSLDFELKINQSKLPICGLIILVGIPCSGKSTLCLELIKKYGSSILHLNQDEIGKDACEKLLSSNARVCQCIVLDRCNLAIDDRKNWIEIYKGLTNNKITCIVFNLGLNLSLERLKSRVNHLTLNSNDSKIIIGASKKFIVPTKNENIDEIINIDNLEQLEALKNKMGIVNNFVDHLDKIIKFPRTKHLTNLGAMTRDDLLFTKSEIDKMTQMEILVEEKIDGANLGFSLDSNGNIRAQNRSHYVNSQSHAQFKKLDSWISTHKTDLMSILNRGKYILYGEWVYSCHTIKYTKLSDYFIMFDLYDIITKNFVSREIIETYLKSTSIQFVPIIFKGKTTLEELKKLVKTQSKFCEKTIEGIYDGNVEGIYVRAFENNIVKYRGKIVRNDFIANGDQHWAKNVQILNTLEIKN